MRDLSLMQQLRIVFMAGRYATAEEIASDPVVHIAPRDVRFFLDRAGFPPPPSDQAKLILCCEIARDLAPVLDGCARARKLGRCTMAEAILESVLDDALVGAVMDDGLP